jgi:glycerate 2-kinase
VSAPPTPDDQLLIEGFLTNTTPAALRDEAAAFFHAACAAVTPALLAARHLVRRAMEVQLTAPDGSWCWQVPTLVIGAGKAAARMAVGCEQALGAEQVYGEVMVADGCGAELRSVRVCEAGHPLPDERGECATRRMVRLVRGHQRGGIVCLISGGASSLMIAPTPPVTRADKIDVTRMLLECGADITEINTVRKHLSEVKGGGLLRWVRTRMAALILSDVVGDDPSTIGSGPTAPDPTTFADAWAVIERYELTDRIPATAARLLRDGVAGRVPETVKPGSLEASRACNVIVGSNRAALEGAAQAARARGWNVEVQPEPLVGDSTAAARAFGAKLRNRLRARSAANPLCILAGGETTVRVRGRGRGGRNQEFALVLAETIAGEEVLVLSAGTDGIDGPTPAAGAFSDGTTCARARARGLSAAAALADNDTFTFFKALGDLFCCGPTGTNVMDIKIVLIPPPPRSCN